MNTQSAKERLISFAKSQTNFSSDPLAMTIEYTSDSRKSHPPNKDICVQSSWEKPDNLDHQLTEKLLYPQKDTDVYQLVSEMLATKKKQINPKNGAKLTTFLIKIQFRSEEELVGDPEWSEKLTDDFFLMGYIEKESKGLDESVQNLIQRVIDKIQVDMSDRIGISDFTDISLLYGDFEYNKLVSIDGTLFTENPHMYYKGPESREEYLDVKANNSKEKQLLLQQTEHRVMVKYGYHTEMPDELCIQAEVVMNKYMSEYIENYPELLFEGERISYDPETNTQFISFWIREPFEWESK